MENDQCEPQIPVKSDDLGEHASQDQSVLPEVNASVEMDDQETSQNGEIHTLNGISTINHSPQQMAPDSKEDTFGGHNKGSEAAACTKGDKGSDLDSDRIESDKLVSHLDSMEDTEKSHPPNVNVASNSMESLVAESSPFKETKAVKDLLVNNSFKESEDNQDMKCSSKILKGILESNVVSYSSDLSSQNSCSNSKSPEIRTSAQSDKHFESTPVTSDENKGIKETALEKTNKDEIIDNDSKETKCVGVLSEAKTENKPNITKIVKSVSKNGESDHTAKDGEKSTENALNGLKNEKVVDSVSTSSQIAGDSAQQLATSNDSSSEIQAQSKATTSNQDVEGQSSCDKFTEKPVKYRCSKCSCVTKDKRLFDNHSCDREFGSEEVKITIELNKEKNSFICKECNFSSTGHGFEEHLMCHLMLRPYQCLYCKECFINRREISRHVINSHNGAKMSCALRALRRAKGLIKDVTAAGTLSFMARVAGKVPLEKDPERKKCGSIQAKAQDDTSKSPAPVHQSDPSKETETTDDVCQKQKEDDKEGANVDIEENEQEDKISKSPVSVPFSKLREVLTADNPLQHVEEKEPSDTNKSSSSVSAVTNEGKEQDRTEEQGLKIIASYSLNEEPPAQETSPEESKEVSNTQKSQPNFFMASSPSTPEPELLSFLGPEHGKQSEARSPRSPLLPPPPLKPAPNHSSIPVSTDTLQQHSSMPAKPEKISSFFICSFNCTFNTISKTEFLEHLVQFHSNETSFSCYYCGHKSSHIEDIVNHIASHADSSVDKKAPLFNCSISDCQFGSNMISDFVNHVSTAHKDGNRPACNACVSVFPEASLLQTHLEENIINIVNCPHCSCKASERRTILNHISSEHPGKPKMVSVAKQLICRDRKMNGFERPQPDREMQPPSLTPAPSLASSSGHGSSVLDQILRQPDPRSVYPGSQSNSSLAEALVGSASTSPRNTPSPASSGVPPYSSRKREGSPDSEKSQVSETSALSGVRVKEEIEEIGLEEPKETETTLENNSSYIIDENGVKRRLYVPMSERHAENFRCQFCTFVARDLKRLACHERSHGMPPTRKDRFKCMFCPQGFDSELKFRLHITCHPGLIKFLLYRCKKCEFDSNQKHTIVKHITCNRDRKHRGIGPVEDQYTIISRSLESRVLECEQCDYMTRHKVHMAIHYQREHGILRDKNEFTIEGLTPSDTPVTGSELHLHDAASPQTESCPQIDAGKSLPANKKRKDSVSSDGTNMSMGEIYERNELFTRLVSQQAALQPGHVLENQARKFKCPICKYLLPKAADLKNHVKRHSEIGQITLVMFRCKYCSCMSTARELLYDHLREKHPGKSIALVKKIVAIDTTETDKSFAETSVEESLQQLEESVHHEIMSAINNNQTQPTTSVSLSNTSSTSFEQLFVIPQGGKTFPDALQCPKCSFNSHHRDEIIGHVTGKHPEVKVISSDEDVDNLAKTTSKDLHRNKILLDTTSSPMDSQEEVLIVPDELTFKEEALCSRCDFSTLNRRDMVLHLQQNHPEIAVMGRNSYPVQVSAMGSKVGENVLEESCVVGSGSLDTKLRYLYENYGTKMKCLICGVQRPKKFFIHVHILRHLNIYLWKCTFCSHRGLQKYKMVDHIKKIHPGHPMSVRYLRVNVESRVAQFMSQFNALHNRASSPDASQSFDEHMDSDDGKKPPQKSFAGSTHALGADELDEKINCLYDYSDGMFYKCLACNNQFQRKFAIHRHIIISHLKVALLSCAYCGMQGVEKHQMVDHVIACHQNQPVSFHTNDVDIAKAVENFLAKSAAHNDDEASESGVSEMLRNFAGSDEAAARAEDYYNRIYPSNKSNLVNLGKKSKFQLGSKLRKVELLKKKKTTGNKNKTIVDPGVIMLGREALDIELRSLYQARVGGQLRCLVCRWEFPRKYPLHRHIMLKHLRMNLVACPYCSFDGVEKYTVSTHIKEEHRDQPISIRYIQPDVKARVRQFLNEMASGSSKIKKQLSSSSSSPTPTLSMLVKMKREKSLDFDNDAEEEGVAEEPEEDDDDAEKTVETLSAGNQGLVVAMFGKKAKKNTISDDIVIKKEVEDVEYENDPKSDHTEINEHNANNEENEDAGGGEEEVEEEEEEEEAGEEEHYPSFFDKEDDATTKESAMDLAKFRKMEAYAPGSYRSPAGGKPKALDVITKIKVLKSKEGPITKFYCEKCKFTSVHRSNIVRHIYKIHERYQTHTCPVCNYQTLSLMLMQTHMKKEHPGVEYREDSFSLNPPRTKPRSRSILSLNKYQLQKRKQKLKIPSFTPSSRTPAPPTNSGPKQYACAYCHYETSTQEDILDHTREKHHQGFVNTGKALESHTSKKSEDKSKACWDRSKKAVKRKLSDGGESSHAHIKRKFVFEKGDELIQCGHCDIRETSMGRMQHHMEWEHAGLSMKFKRIPAWRFVCKTCAVKTMATSKMKYHLNRHVSYRPYTCINCGAFFPSPDQCRRHARANRHEEQYMYVRNAKKEQRVEELLQETRQLALRIQEEAYNDPTFDIANIETFMSRFQDTKHNLKRTGSASSSRSSKKAKLDEKGEAPVRKQVGKSPQTVGIEMNVTIKCYNCDFQANTVHQVNQHHKKAHSGEQFFWTELDRNFTCDRTGEALPNSDSLPNASGDVGYSTKISLSAGSNSTRFKCKSCDFSSSVIQAMKSHLKSHQPKGYICPYCSRFFSGKEKLMRHQYCLHKGLSIWVIHLRKSSSSSSTPTKSASSVSTVNPHVTRSVHEASPLAKEPIEEKEEGEEEVEEEEGEEGGQESALENGSINRNSAHLRYVCNECSFSSDNLLQYRQHLSKAHAAFRQVSRDTSSSPVGNEEEEKEMQPSDDKEVNFQCGHCQYQASEITEIEAHHEQIHAGEESQILNMRSQKSEEETEDTNKPLLNLEPRVSVQRITSETIAWYDDSRSPNSDDGHEESFEETCKLKIKNYDPLESNSMIENSRGSAIRMTFNTVKRHDEDGNEEENLIEEGVSQSGDQFDDCEGVKENSDDINDENADKDLSHFTDEEEEERVEDKDFEQMEEQGEEEEEEGINESEEEYEEQVDAEMDETPGSNSEHLARQLKLMDDQSSPLERSEPDMMIMEFDSMRNKQALMGEGENDISENDHHRKSVARVGGDDKNEEDDEDDEFDDSNVTLASPLPMISLGDGVTMSPDMFDSNKSEVHSERSQGDSQYSDQKEDFDAKNLLDF